VCDVYIHIQRREREEEEEEERERERTYMGSSELPFSVIFPRVSTDISDVIELTKSMYLSTDIQSNDASLALSKIDPSSNTTLRLRSSYVLFTIPVTMLLLLDSIIEETRAYGEAETTIS
jgi:hypothetical protein